MSTFEDLPTDEYEVEDEVDNSENPDAEEEEESEPEVL